MLTAPPDARSRSSGSQARAITSRRDAITVHNHSREEDAEQKDIPSPILAHFQSDRSPAGKTARALPPPRLLERARGDVQYPRKTGSSAKIAQLWMSGHRISDLHHRRSKRTQSRDLPLVWLPTCNSTLCSMIFVPTLAISRISTITKTKHGRLHTHVSP